MDRNEQFLFNLEKESVFVHLAKIVLSEKAFLVLNGDIFDFTGMTPCQKGKKEFFDEAVPAEKQIPELIAKNSRTRLTGEILADIQKVFPNFFRALSDLASENRLIYIPGNHDCDLLNPASQKAFTEILGVSSDKVKWARQYLIGESLVVTHGNQYDPPNITENTCLNPGLIFTSALYTAVLPALEMLGVQSDIIAAIPAVRPEENVILDLQKFLSEKDLQKILLALTRLLARNNYFTGIRAIPGWFLTREIPLLSGIFRRKVTTSRVQSLLPKDEKLMSDARMGARALFNKLKSDNHINDKTMIVLGHTHEVDRDTNYINLGTWLDHLRGLDPEEIATPEISLPVLKSSGLSQHDIVEFKNLRGFENFYECPHMPRQQKSL